MMHLSCNHFTEVNEIFKKTKTRTKTKAKTISPSSKNKVMHKYSFKANFIRYEKTNWFDLREHNNNNNRYKRAPIFFSLEISNNENLCTDSSHKKKSRIYIKVKVFKVIASYCMVFAFWWKWDKLKSWIESWEIKMCQP